MVEASEGKRSAHCSWQGWVANPLSPTERTCDLVHSPCRRPSRPRSSSSSMDPLVPRLILTLLANKVAPCHPRASSSYDQRAVSPLANFDNTSNINMGCTPAAGTSSRVCDCARGLRQERQAKTGDGYISTHRFTDAHHRVTRRHHESLVTAPRSPALQIRFSGSSGRSSPGSF